MILSKRCQNGRVPVWGTATRWRAVVRIEVGEPCPLPDDPVLAEWATAMRDTRDMGDWGWIVDSSWKLRFVTDEQRLSLAYDIEMAPILIGEHLFGPEMTEMSTHWRTDANQQQADLSRSTTQISLYSSDEGRA